MGGGGSSQHIEQVTGSSKKADKEGFLVVYTDGTGQLPHHLLTWNAGFCCGYALEEAVDDIGFIRALIRHLQEKYIINEKMTYVTGISNGGCMAYRVGSELSDIVAAIAPVAVQIGGQATEDEKLWCIPEPQYPVSVISFNGMNDSRVPYEGGRPANNDTHVFYWMSTNESIAFWVGYNKCDKTPKKKHQ